LARYFVIEGLIGVGKTTLCRLIRDHWGARLILEPAADNPFLAAFYSDKERYAFPAQMFYLATRYAQQAELRQGELFDEMIVADYLFEKDRLFAEQTLVGHELDLYERFASHLGATIVRPEFVLFLDSPTDVVLKRIGRRAISAEQVIEPEYLDSLRDAYHRLWASYKDAPVYVLDTQGLNYVDSEEDRLVVLEMIQGWLDGRPVPGSPASVHAEREEMPNLFSSGAT